MTLDPNLKQYATEKQWEYMEAIEEHGGGRKAAEVIGASSSAINQARRAVIAKAVKQGYSPEHDYNHALPDGQKLRGISTYYDKDGKVRGQWVKGQEDRERQAEMMREAFEGFASQLPKALPVTPTQMDRSSSLMACYPVGDHHTGMLSWDKETGGDYDLLISEKLLTGAINELVSNAPACDEATLVFLGDFLHYDSFAAETPTSRNQLDADSRFPKMVRTGIRMMRYTVEQALTKHMHVRIIVEIGNHDLSCSIFLMECLMNVYENEPRVTVDTSPMHYHYFSFGKVLVGTHHGHGAKMTDLPLIMAHDQPKMWGEAKYRYWWTGHIHHDKQKNFFGTQDVQGTRVESFRILAPSDAWAAQKGYRPMQDMKCVVLHKEFGEVSRHTVNPEMLK